MGVWELEQVRLELIRQQEEAARMELARANSGIINPEPTVDDKNFILPGSLKGIAIENEKLGKFQFFHRKSCNFYKFVI
jgi:hypothetical protein